MRSLRNPPKKPLTENQKDKLIKSRLYKKGEDLYIKNSQKIHLCGCKTNVTESKNEYFIFIQNVLHKFDKNSIKQDSLSKNFYQYIFKRISFLNKRG